MKAVAAVFFAPVALALAACDVVGNIGPIAYDDDMPLVSTSDGGAGGPGGQSGKVPTNAPLPGPCKPPTLCDGFEREAVEPDQIWTMIGTAVGATLVIDGEHSASGKAAHFGVEIGTTMQRAFMQRDIPAGTTSLVVSFWIQLAHLGVDATLVSIRQGGPDATTSPAARAQLYALDLEGGALLFRVNSSGEEMRIPITGFTGAGQRISIELTANALLPQVRLDGVAVPSGVASPKMLPVDHPNILRIGIMANSRGEDSLDAWIDDVRIEEKQE